MRRGEERRDKRGDALGKKGKNGKREGEEVGEDELGDGKQVSTKHTRQAKQAPHAQTRTGSIESKTSMYV